jgi:hypothetical protein
VYDPIVEGRLIKQQQQQQQTGKAARTPMWLRLTGMAATFTGTFLHSTDNVCCSTTAVPKEFDISYVCNEIMLGLWLRLALWWQQPQVHSESSPQQLSGTHEHCMRSI